MSIKSILNLKIVIMIVKKVKDTNLKIVPSSVRRSNSPPVFVSVMSREIFEISKKKSKKFKFKDFAKPTMTSWCCFCRVLFVY